MNINHTFGTYIKDKRLAKQISLRKFAELLDISPVYLCNIEKDRNPAPKDDIISNMARLLMLNDTETAELYDLAAKAKSTLSSLSDASEISSDTASLGNTIFSSPSFIFISYFII